MTNLEGFSLDDVPSTENAKQGKIEGKEVFKEKEKTAEEKEKTAEEKEKTAENLTKIRAAISATTSTEFFRARKSKNPDTKIPDDFSQKIRSELESKNLGLSATDISQIIQLKFLADQLAQKLQTFRAQQTPDQNPQPPLSPTEFQFLRNFNHSSRALDLPDRQIQLDDIPRQPTNYSTLAQAAADPDFSLSTQLSSDPNFQETFAPPADTRKFASLDPEQSQEFLTAIPDRHPAQRQKFQTTLQPQLQNFFWPPSDARPEFRAQFETTRQNAGPPDKNPAPPRQKLFSSTRPDQNFTDFSSTKTQEFFSSLDHETQNFSAELRTASEKSTFENLLDTALTTCTRQIFHLFDTITTNLDDFLGDFHTPSDPDRELISRDQTSARIALDGTINGTPVHIEFDPRDGSIWTRDSISTTPDGLVVLDPDATGTALQKIPLATPLKTLSQTREISTQNFQKFSAENPKKSQSQLLDEFRTSPEFTDPTELFSDFAQNLDQLRQQKEKAIETQLLDPEFQTLLGATLPTLPDQLGTQPRAQKIKNFLRSRDATLADASPQQLRDLRSDLQNFNTLISALRDPDRNSGIDDEVFQHFFGPQTLATQKSSENLKNTNFDPSLPKFFAAFAVDPQSPTSAAFPTSLDRSTRNPQNSPTPRIDLDRFHATISQLARRAETRSNGKTIETDRRRAPAGDQLLTTIADETLENSDAREKK